MNKVLRALPFVAIMGILLAACGAPATPAAPAATEAPAATDVPAATEAPAAPKILRLRVSGDLTNADPAFHPAEVDGVVAEAIHEGLVTFKAGTWEVVNVLAETIQASDDGLQIDFKLREGVQFHAGYGELTAEDVKYSYERFQDPELNASYAGDWAALDHVEVTGKYTGTIVLKEPFAPLWASTLPVTGGVIVSKKAVEEMGAAAYATHPIGTGPYEFGEWTPGDKIVLKRFADYWGEPAPFDEMYVIPIADDSAGEIALEAGEVDFGSIPLDSVERFEANDDFEVIKISTMDYNGLLMNVQYPGLDDINVRQAIRYAVDVPAILDAAYDGMYVRACALLAPGQVGYWADAPCYEPDLEKARGFMEQAGVDSLDLTLTFLNRESNKSVAEVIQANLAEIGINVELIVQDDAAYWDGGFGETGLADRQLTLIEWGTTNPDPYWLTVWFTCDQVLQYNWMYWCEESFDRLNNEATLEQDPERRAEMYLEMQKIWDEAAHTVWTAHPVDYFAARKTIHAGQTPNGNFVPVAFKPK